MRNELLETPVELANASSVEPPDPPIRKPKLKETSCTATVLLAGEEPTVLAKLSLLTSAAPSTTGAHAEVQVQVTCGPHGLGLGLDENNRVQQHTPR